MAELGGSGGDLGGGGITLSQDIQDALNGANAPSAGNVFATMADVAAAGAPQNLQSVLNTGSSATITSGAPFVIVNEIASPEQTRFYMDDLLTEWSTTGLTGMMRIQIDGASGLEVLDNELSKGFRYAADYSVAGIVDPRWIPDYGAVTAAIAAATPPTPGLNAVMNVDSAAALSSKTFNVTIIDGTGFIATTELIQSALGTGATSWLIRNSNDLATGIQQIELQTDGASAGTGTMTVTDTVSTKGLVYAADYSANFTDESLITKRYADVSNGIYGASNSLTLAHTATFGAFGLTYNTSLAGKFNIRQANFVLAGAVSQTRITNDKGDILNISNGNNVEWNNQNVGGVSQNITHQNWIGHFNRYQFRSAIHAGSQPNNYNLMEVQLGASPPMSPVNIGINVTAPALSGVAVRQRMSRAGSSTVNQIHTGYELYDDVGTLNIGTQAGFSTYKTGFSANLNDIYTRSVAGALKNINRAFHANAQNGDLNYAFHAENGDVIVNSGDVQIGAATSTADRLSIRALGTDIATTRLINVRNVTDTTDIFYARQNGWCYTNTLGIGFAPSASFRLAIAGNTWNTGNLRVGGGSGSDRLGVRAAASGTAVMVTFENSLGSDTFTVTENGLIEFPSLTIAKIDAGAVRGAVTKEWVQAEIATGATYTPTNVVTDRSYDANATTVDELADILGTLIADLQGVNILL